MSILTKKKDGKRDYKARLIIGTKGQGKSSILKHYMEEYEEKFGQVYRNFGVNTRVFIHDYSTSKAFRHIPTVEQVIDKAKLKVDHPLDLLSYRDTNGKPVWNKGKIRYTGTSTADLKYMNHMLSRHFRNGMVICDEWTVYVKANPPDWQKELANNHRNYGIELFLVCHQILAVPPYFVRGDIISEIILFKTGERNIDYNQVRRKYSCADDLWEAFQRLNRKKNTDYIVQPYEIIKV